MSGGDCFKCGRPGHWARECRNGPVGGGGGNFVRDNRSPRMDVRNDFRNGDFRNGDFRSNGRGGVPEDKCYKCNRPGHFARECRLEQDRCYKCNQLGHIAKECDKDIDSGACYNCKSTGHVQRDCPEVSSRPCYRCGETGHLARECPREERERSSLASIINKKCYGCGGVGHISRECPTAQRSMAKECYRGGVGPIRSSRCSRPPYRTGPYRWPSADTGRAREVKWN